MDEAARRDWRYLLVTVSGIEARATIRAQLAAWGLGAATGRRVRCV